MNYEYFYFFSIFQDPHSPWLPDFLVFSHMAKSSEPWEHKLGGLANKGETQFHADEDNDNSDDNDDNDNNDGELVMLLKVMMTMKK